MVLIVSQKEAYLLEGSYNKDCSYWDFLGPLCGKLLDAHGDSKPCADFE